MNRIDQMLATIQALVMGTTDYNDVMRLERPAHLIEQEANGPDRGALVLSRVIEALRERPGVLETVDGYLMLITTGRATPCTLRELITLHSGLEQAIGRDLRMTKILHQEDSRTDDRLSVALLIQLVENCVEPA